MSTQKQECIALLKKHIRQTYAPKESLTVSPETYRLYTEKPPLPQPSTPLPFPKPKAPQRQPAAPSSPKPQAKPFSISLESPKELPPPSVTVEQIQKLFPEVSFQTTPFSPCFEEIVYFFVLEEEKELLEPLFQAVHKNLCPSKWVQESQEVHQQLLQGTPRLLIATKQALRTYSEAKTLYRPGFFGSTPLLFLPPLSSLQDAWAKATLWRQLKGCLQKSS